MLEIKNVSKTFAKDTVNEHKALNNINLTLNVLILLMRFLFSITEHKHQFVCSILIPILISRRDISIATGIN